MPLPQVPARFAALEELARGETGVLVRARDTLLQREVVLKLPPEGTLPSAEGERELREARALARVQHRAIVRLLDVVESPSGPVLVLEPTSGESLAEKLAGEQRLEAEYVRTLALELADALAAVHAIGVVHRGITLDQIVLGQGGKPLLGGFGFAKFSGPAVAIPGTTFLYAREEQGPTSLPPHPAPEQIAGQTADARSDLFGLGWVLYECLTGEEPYPIELEVEHWKTPRDPRALVPGTPRDLSDAVLRCLAKSPAKRFASAEELRAALVRPDTTPVGATHRRDMHWRLPLIAAGLLAVGLVAYKVWPDQASTRGGGERGLPISTLNPADLQLGGKPYSTLHALVIGIDEYTQWPQLHYAVADAEAVAKVLVEKYGFESGNVITLRNEDATKARIQDVFSGELRHDTKKDDGVLVYFAGHGQTDELPNGGNIGFLVPVGGELDRAHDLSSLIEMDEIETWSKLIPAKHVFFILDACFGGLAAGRGMADADRAYIGSLARKTARQVLTSGGKDQEVNESPELGHSYFTNRLLCALRDEEADSAPKDGIISAVELYSYLQTTVFKDTSGLRHPQSPQLGTLKFDNEGQFLFLTPRAREGLRGQPSGSAAGPRTVVPTESSAIPVAKPRSESDKKLTAQPYARMHAIVIGINNYDRWPPLACAVADAMAMADLLEEKYGFEPANVTRLTDAEATRYRIQQEVGELSTRASWEDGLLVYFAGYGQTTDLPWGGSMGYLVPVDGETGKSANLASLIAMDDVFRWARALPCKHVFFVFDSCFGGLAVSHETTDSTQEYIGMLAHEPARLILTAGGKDQEVADLPALGHSFFTRRLLDGLGQGLADRDRNGVITAGELAHYVQALVPRDTAGLGTRQDPQYCKIGDSEGEFLFLSQKVREELNGKK